MSTNRVMIILAAPIAVGKSTLIKRLREEGFNHIKTVTTRKRRGGADNEYIFLPRWQLHWLSWWHRFIWFESVGEHLYSIRRCELEPARTTHSIISITPTSQRAIGELRGFCGEHGITPIFLFLEPPERGKLVSRAFGRLPVEQKTDEAMRSIEERLDREMRWPELVYHQRQYNITPWHSIAPGTKDEVLEQVYHILVSRLVCP